MATISNTPRPGYAWDATDNCWYPIGTGPHTHSDYISQSTAINPTIVDAKGDIITATAADTPARLGVGTNGQLLYADSTAATGLKWDGAPAGKVVQIVSVNYSTQVSTSSGSEVDTGLTATITPTSSSNKVLVLLSQNVGRSDSNSTIDAKLYRASTSINTQFGMARGGPNYYNTGFSFNSCILDSPATTSATTYKTTIRESFGAGGQIYANQGGSTSTMTLMEVTP
jgi:hypothetical protein